MCFGSSNFGIQMERVFCSNSRLTGMEGMGQVANSGSRSGQIMTHLKLRSHVRIRELLPIDEMFIYDNMNRRNYSQCQKIPLKLLNIVQPPKWRGKAVCFPCHVV
jgi:hypothetical protein